MKASGVILAGGRSSRMKLNKAFVQISGRTIIHALIEKFESHFEETMIISNEPHLFTNLGPKVYTDVYPRMGPVSGIHSALFHTSYDAVFVLGCDMPFVSMELVKYMFDRLEDHDSVVPEIDSILQPLAAVYSRKALPIFTDCLEKNRLKLVRVFKEELDACILRGSELEAFGPVREQFFNINDMEALNKANEIARRYL